MIAPRALPPKPQNSDSTLPATPVIVSMSSMDSTPGSPMVASPTSFGGPLPQVMPSQYDSQYCSRASSLKLSCLCCVCLVHYCCVFFVLLCVYATLSFVCDLLMLFCAIASSLKYCFRKAVTACLFPSARPSAAPYYYH